MSDTLSTTFNCDTSSTPAEEMQIAGLNPTSNQFSEANAFFSSPTSQALAKTNVRPRHPVLGAVDTNMPPDRTSAMDGALAEIVTARPPDTKDECQPEEEGLSKTAQKACSSVPESENASPKTDPVATAQEVLLAKQIGELWSTQNTKASLIRLDRKELQQSKDELKTRLHAYKKILVGTGRDGRWAEFLREQKIPISTADRYVKEHDEKLGEANKLLSENPLSAADRVGILVKKMVPSLRKKLPNPDLVQLFLDRLKAELQPPLSES